MLPLLSRLRLATIRRTNKVEKSVEKGDESKGLCASKQATERKEEQRILDIPRFG